MYYDIDTKCERNETISNDLNSVQLEHNAGGSPTNCWPLGDGWKKRQEPKS